MAVTVQIDSPAVSSPVSSRIRRVEVCFFCLRGLRVAFLGAAGRGCAGLAGGGACPGSDFLPGDVFGGTDGFFIEQAALLLSAWNRRLVSAGEGDNSGKGGARGSYDLNPAWTSVSFLVARYAFEKTTFSCSLSINTLNGER